MPKISKDSPAFPTADDVCVSLSGLTKREWFIGMAMQGLVLAGPIESAVMTAVASIRIADVIIEKLNEEQK